ncbi:uncharacterized protein FOKN1_0576 [Thiohalobacter thiocyanaticus]|uniref:DUF4351 domain-containing protein n=1 Tax=Thiohalobacter thiocyanaticus TaxID=585455 RepID=A0A1Z4VNQ6_9GAMM|nr:DUF4351 domain-containing protein [Thiohalobacter thiocyanaticus]BAZ92978.1 uncharacterized protein FOKN1_0576 [Thiohalobacter thiocyanaticus]
MDHDQNFKNLILDYPRQALELFAAAEAEALDATVQITPVRQEQLKERLGERFRELDVPLQVQWPDGRREAILFVVEEESEPGRFSLHRLAHYCLDLSELLDCDRVVPVVVFLRRGRRRERLALGGERHTYLSFHYLACVLPELSFEQYRDSPNIVARLNLPNMRHASGQRVEVYAQAVRGLTELEPHPEKQLKYLDFVDIYAGLDEAERARYQEEYREEAEKMSTFAERFRQQGMQQGEAQVLLRQMTRRFGPLPEPVRQRIETADAEQLLEWSERVLTAASAEEVLN